MTDLMAMAISTQSEFIKYEKGDLFAIRILNLKGKRRQDEPFLPP